MPSPQLRAAAVSLLSAIAGIAPLRVGPLLPQLLELCSDSWWEVRAQLVILASTLLSALPADDASEDAGALTDAADDILHTVLGEDCGGAVLRIGVAHLVQALPNRPSLLGLFVTSLLELEPDARERLLGLDATAEFDELPLVGANGCR